MDWWEKTVEYLFVTNFFNYDAVVAPLDGFIGAHPICVKRFS